MESSERLIHHIAVDLKEEALRIEKEIMMQFPPLLGYDLLVGRKYYLSHNLDPPWDRSGHLYSKSIDATFDKKDYKKVKEFFEEFRGNSIASFVSGCGLYYETYGEYYKEWMIGKYQNAHYAVLENLNIDVVTMLTGRSYDKDSSDIEERVDCLMDEVNEFVDQSYFYAENLFLKIIEMDLHFVYKLGEKKARKRLHRMRVDMENEMKNIEQEKAVFNRFWPLLEKKHKLVYQKSFPSRIEMPEFESFQRFLQKQNVSEQEMNLIGKYAPISFSNSVTNKLQLKP
ncbi:hypothetical protein [Sporosarcina ureilytica]|uniref:Uncharacterized protein n=1 Tax=Sporosarcina ureilytica TaxID=298596 RepID=A0A1D8JFS1_9BACL|nr:hypothetical protein [Sporosarcina ureilytica]AOV07559.1 hypothetical protein BI350_08450 [Sporosarcina ureilytica]